MGALGEGVSTLRTSDGFDILVTCRGEGTPILLIHGATIDAAYNWVQSGIGAALVDAGYRVLMPDLRGHGASDRPVDAGAMTMELFASDMVLVLDAFGVDRTVAVGYSLGALIALRLAAEDHRVRAVVAGGVSLEGLEPAPLPPERLAYIDQLGASSDEEVTDERARQMRAWDRSQGQDPRARAALIRAINAPRGIDLASVQVPTLVVNATADPAPDSLVALLAGARGATVEGDHASVLSHPELTRLIVEFVDASVGRP